MKALFEVDTVLSIFGYPAYAGKFAYYDNGKVLEVTSGWVVNNHSTWELFNGSIVTFIDSVYVPRGTRYLVQHPETVQEAYQRYLNKLITEE